MTGQNVYIQHVANIDYRHVATDISGHRYQWPLISVATDIYIDHLTITIALTNAIYLTQPLADQVSTTHTHTHTANT